MLKVKSANRSRKFTGPHRGGARRRTWALETVAETGNGARPAEIQRVATAMPEPIIIVPAVRFMSLRLDVLWKKRRLFAAAKA